jgi:hypothetical protein
LAIVCLWPIPVPGGQSRPLDTGGAAPPHEPHAADTAPECLCRDLDAGHGSQCVSSPPASADWMKEEFELLGLPFEDRGQLTDEYPCRRLFIGTYDDMATLSCDAWHTLPVSRWRTGVSAYEGYRRLTIGCLIAPRTCPHVTQSGPHIGEVITPASPFAWCQGATRPRGGVSAPTPRWSAPGNLGRRRCLWQRR